MAQSREEIHKRARNEAEDYETTVQALIALKCCILYDGTTLIPGSQFGLGRRMTTSKDNPVLPREKVTPDLVVQQTSEYGVVAELKRSLERDETTWPRHLTQLRKYDDHLLGWWTPSSEVTGSDAWLVVHHSRSRRLVHVTTALAKDDAATFGPRSAIIEFVKNQEAEPFIFFRREHGVISNAALADKLEKGVNIPLGVIRGMTPPIRFYDCQPPMEHFLAFLWTDLLPATAERFEYDPQLGAIPVDVTVDSVTVELQRAYGSGALEADERSAEFPQRGWVRRALDTLVQHKLASPGKIPGAYTVLFRSFKRDVLLHFAELLAAKQSKGRPVSGEQLSLLTNEEPAQ